MTHPFIANKIYPIQQVIAFLAISAVEQSPASSTAQSFHNAESQRSGMSQGHSDRLLNSGGALGSCMQSRMPQNSRLLANVGNNTTRLRSWTAGPKTDEYGSKLTAFNLEDMAGPGIFPPSLSYVREMLLEFAEGDKLWDKETLILDNGNHNRLSDSVPVTLRRMINELKICEHSKSTP